jgi:conserved repeat domain
MKLFHRHKPTEIAATAITNTSTVKIKGVPSLTTEVTFYVEKSADLMVTQNTNKPIVYVGENLTYTIIVTNNGPSNATDVILYDILPIETTFVSLVINQGTYDHKGSLVTCSLGGLASGSFTIITIIVTANVSGIIKNFTRVAGNEFDPDIENNMFLETTTIYPPQPRYRGFDFF